MAVAQEVSMLLKPSRTGRWLACGILVLLVLQRSSMAASPTIVMIYGGDMPKPLFVMSTSEERVTDTLFLWGRASDGTTVGQLAGRPYLEVAMFWGRDQWSEYLAYPGLLSRLQPADANQHGRLYLPAPDRPAAMVVTTIQGEAPGEPSEGALVAGWRLSEADVDNARRLGIPGFEIGAAR
jgi:hypothetical protein